MFAKLLRLFLNQRVPRSNSELLNILYGRKSCRNFKNQAVSKEIIEEIVKIGALTPSTVNLQTWSFFPFTKDEWQEKFQSPIPFGAGGAIIICADLKRLEVVDTAFKSYPLFFYTLAVMNASLSAMNMTLAVEALGMKSIMLSQTGRTGLCDIKYLKEKLVLPKMVFPITTLAFGYPASEVLFSPPKLKPSVVSHTREYHLDSDEMKKWFEDMNFVCKMIDREHLTEKFEKYLKLLPQAEKELNAVLEEIKD
ncbi:MAG: nitroreductase family protein [Proteobacteria bacterium]|nr:nitroreductase family protein [Pseudomonadota bacterium]